MRTHKAAQQSRAYTATNATKPQQEGAMAGKESFEEQHNDELQTELLEDARSEAVTEEVTEEAAEELTAEMPDEELVKELLALRYEGAMGADEMKQMLRDSHHFGGRDIKPLYDGQ